MSMQRDYTPEPRVDQPYLFTASFHGHELDLHLAPRSMFDEDGEITLAYRVGQPIRFPRGEHYDRLTRQLFPVLAGSTPYTLNMATQGFPRRDIVLLNGALRLDYVGGEIPGYFSRPLYLFTQEY